MATITPEDPLVTIKLMPKLICFECFGEQSYEHTIRRFNKMYATLKENNIWDVLIEGKTSKRLSVLDSYNAIKYIQEKLGKDAIKVRIAFLDERQKGFEHNVFAENVASNRGLCLRFFQDRERALCWLQGAAIPKLPSESHQV
ncbi:MAG: hypothetical protein KTR30_23050 [Saprospiraceae bacterium]|nr:hypothetical protein [Saprospiraceae bacterium]